MSWVGAPTGGLWSAPDPLFSVILPTHDRGEMLARAVRSVLSQELPDFELIVVDDGSAEEHTRVLSSFVDPRVRVLRNPEQLGVSEARNRGIRTARGRYISFLDDDDEYRRSFLGATRDRLKDTPPEIAASWSGIELLEYHVAGAPPTRSIRQFLTEYPTRLSLFQAFLSIGMGFGVTVKADALREVGLFDPRLRAVEDTDLFIRLLARGFLPTGLEGAHVIVHCHREPRLSERKMYPARIEGCEHLLREHGPFLNEHPSIAQGLVRGIAWLRSAL